MEKKLRWSWSLFDRVVTVFAAGCGAAGAYFAYTGPLISAATPQTAQLNNWGADIPWWSISLIALSLVLLIVQFSRSNSKQESEAARLERENFESVLKRVEGNLADLRREVEVDYPNSSNIVEAFHRLDEATKIKIDRFEDRIKDLPERFQRDNLDLMHLLYFATLQATERSLQHILSKAPIPKLDENADLNAEGFKANSDFLDRASQELSSSHRYSDYRNVLLNAENETDKRLSVLPPSQWPPGLNPIDLRRYFRAAMQRKSVCECLQREQEKVREDIRLSRSRMIERYEERNSR